MPRIAFKRPKSDEMCAPGFHIVHGFTRICHSGKPTWVRTHLAKNRSKAKSIYLEENISFLYWNADVDGYEDLNGVKGFAGHHEVDIPIQFWINYWKSQGLRYPRGFDPLTVKVMMAEESSFDPNAVTADVRSSATGLLQITSTSRQEMMGRRFRGAIYVPDNLIFVQQEDLKNPLINIAAATRWLAVKYAKIPRPSEKNTYNMLKSYKEWNSNGDAYAKGILEKYRQSK